MSIDPIVRIKTPETRSKTPPTVAAPSDSSSGPGGYLGAGIDPVHETTGDQSSDPERQV